MNKQEHCEFLVPQLTSTYRALEGSSLIFAYAVCIFVTWVRADITGAISDSVALHIRIAIISIRTSTAPITAKGVDTL